MRMVSKFHFGVVSILVLLFFSLRALAQHRGEAASVERKSGATSEYVVRPSIYDFASGTDDESDAEAMRIVGEYRRSVALLVEQMKRQRLPPLRKIHIIYTLGTLRARSAIGPLIDCIELQDPKYVDFEVKGRVIRNNIPRWGEYPAVGALVKIGYPAAYQILRRLPDERNALRRRLKCSVIIGVAGSEFGQTLIERAADSTKDAQKRRELRETLKEFASVRE